MARRLHLVEQGLIHDATTAPAKEQIACFTTLCSLESGSWLCSFQNGPVKNGPTTITGLCRSRDGGRSWQRLPWRFESAIGGCPGSLSGGEMVEVSPGRLLLFTTWFDRSDPQRPLFDPVTEGILKSRQLYAISTDEGDSWSGWREIVTPGLTGRAMTGPVVRWADGTIGFAFESFKDFDEPQPSRHAAWLSLSRDGGETWEPPRQVAQHPEHRLYYWDQRICTGPEPGSYTVLFWTHDLAEKRDRNVYLLHDSLDSLIAGGPHRPQPVETTIPGQIAAPLWLDDGRLLAFVVDRNRPGTMRLWQSSDRGHSWPIEDSLVVYTHDEQAALTQGQTNIDFAEYWEDMARWSFGHPALRRLDNRHVLCAHYAGTPTKMSVRWERVEV